MSAKLGRCRQCGACCRLFLINLTEAEYKSKTYITVNQDLEAIEDFSYAEEAGANIIEQNEDGSCIYLDDSRCQIHDRRPMHCRQFFCDSKKEEHADMIMHIKEHKAGSEIRQDQR